LWKVVTWCIKSVLMKIALSEFNLQLVIEDFLRRNIEIFPSDLFDSSTTLKTIDEQLKQLDGADDSPKQKVKRRRLGARGSVQSDRSKSGKGSDTVTKSWLLKELDQVLEMPPEALDQLQQGILDDLQSQPEAIEEVQFSEEIQPPNKKANKQSVDADDKHEATSSRVEEHEQIEEVSSIRLRSKVKVTRFVINENSLLSYYIVYNMVFAEAPKIWGRK
jgi:hypothetical protein